MGMVFRGKTVVLTTGTFLNGLIHIGDRQIPAGRMGEAPARGLSTSLAALGLVLALWALTIMVLSGLSLRGRTDADLCACGAPKRDYANPVYRAHRAFQNALETSGPFLAATVAAILTGAGSAFSSGGNVKKMADGGGLGGGRRSERRRHRHRGSDGRQGGGGVGGVGE